MAKLVTGKVRFSYAHVFVPTAMEEGQEKKYNISILIPKSDKATIAKAKAAIEEAYQKALKDKWGGKAPKKWNNPLRDGDVDKDDEVYAGHYFINAKSTKKPKIVDKDFNEILDPEDFYSGCYGRASVNFFAFDTAGNKGVAAGLENLMKLSDGEALGGSAAAPEDDFADNDEFVDGEDLV